MKSTIALIGLLSLMTVSTAQAQSFGSPVGNTISFQGFVTDDGGIPLNQNDVEFTFTLYKDDVKVWEEIQNLDVAGGLLQADLGSVALLDTVAFDDDMELGITPGVAPEIAPRTPLAAAAFAFGMRGMATELVFGSIGEVSVNVIGGHSNNRITNGAVGATIAGGGGDGGVLGERRNTVFGDWGTVGGGAINKAGLFSTVSGGFFNAAVGESATVPGGAWNIASGRASLAAGYKARAKHEGSFVWSDRSITSGDDSTLSTGNNQFLIRAEGGVGIGTTNPVNNLHVVGSANGSASDPNHVTLIEN